jgi:hypothetical protein
MYYQASLLSFMANKLGRIDGEKGENCLLKQLFDKESESEWQSPAGRKRA